MLENAVARRYAQAFFAIAQEKSLVDKLEEELKLVVDLINSSTDLTRVVNHQLVSPEEKKAVIEKLVSQEVSELTMDFLKVVIDKYRASSIPAIYDEFVTYANELRNMADAEVKTAGGLNEAQLAAINEKLAVMTGKTIRLQSKVDPSLIGGVVVRVGDKIIDGSVAGRLDILKDKLLKTEVKEIGVRN